MGASWSNIFNIMDVAMVSIQLECKDFSTALQQSKVWEREKLDLLRI